MRFQLYKRRTGRYLEFFRAYTEDAEVILDVGCGEGAFSKALDNGKHMIIALDIRKGPLREIKGISIERICADAYYLPFQESSIDCIFCISLMEHLQKPEKHVKESYRVVKKGIVILQLPNLRYLFESHTKWPLLYLSPKSFQSRVFRMLGITYVNMNVTVKYALTLIANAGFRLKPRTKVYHVNIMKLLPIAPAYIFIVERAC